MLPAGWCSAPELGNGEELASSLPSHCYPQAGNQSHLFSLSSLSNGKEVEERCAGMSSTAKDARKRQPQTCLTLFSSPTLEKGGLQLQEHEAHACLFLPRGAGSEKVGAALLPCTTLGGGMDANAGILQCCTFVLFMPAFLPDLAGNIPAFPMRSALLWLCSLRSACTC